MKQFLTCIIVVIAILVFTAKPCYAQESDSSAVIKTQEVSENFDYRAENLRLFFQKYNSPLAPYSEDFVKYADAYGIDYRMVPAITGVESTFGKQIPSNSYNAYGWANGDYKFESWEDSISVVTQTLRSKYIDKGAPSISKIARRYAPPSTTWGTKVKYFVGKIDTLPLDFDIVI